MTYYILKDDVTIAERWHLGDVLSGPTTARLHTGLPFSGALSTTINHPGQPLEFCLTSFGVPVANSRLGRAIESVAATDIQRLPLEIPGHSCFEVINVLRTLWCVDESRSKVMKWTLEDHRPDLVGRYRMVIDLHVDHTTIPRDAGMFRVGGWIAIVVSEEVRRAMENAGCRGAKFVECT